MINIISIITSKDNKKIKYVSKLLCSTEFRKKEKLFIAEGIRLCNDALINHCDIKSAFLTETIKNNHKDLYEQIKANISEAFIVSDNVLNKISTTKTPQGIIFLCQIPTITEINCKHNILLLENIQNPLNMGTILRSAEAFGVSDIIVTGNSCDVYSPKVVRGSMGGVLRLNILREHDSLKILKSLKGKVVTCATVPDKNAISILDIDFDENIYLIAIGNEANGLNKETIDLCDKMVTIPMYGKAESLNVAVSASILIWEMTKH